MTEPAPVVLVIDDEIQIRRFLRAGLGLYEEATIELDANHHSRQHLIEWKPRINSR